ncbi:PKDCC [Mytilus edulis]|uniref:PKDCC n=1 Tax=Mytilus edulis TaxID=6550 RepID=A0A8S3TK46_MYTED|nr:PKDCC [Mytilus edulis]
MIDKRAVTLMVAKLLVITSILQFTFYSLFVLDSSIIRKNSRREVKWKMKISDDLDIYSQFLQSGIKKNDILLFKNKYIFNCTNIHKIDLHKYNVGGGRSKTVDIGTFQGQMVVVKRISTIKRKVIGNTYRQLLFMKEILLGEQLEHPGLISMMGFCFKHLYEDSYKKSQLHSGISAVYEYGEEFNITDLTLTTDERLSHALDLATLLLYLHTSPLGSLVIGDFNKNHFLMVNNKIKLIDYDYMHNIEYPCVLSQNSTLIKKCPFQLTCQQLDTRELANSSLKSLCNNENDCNLGECREYNLRTNIQNIHKTFLKYLLKPKFFNPVIQKMLSELTLHLIQRDISIGNLVNQLENIMHINKND